MAPNHSVILFACHRFHPAVIREFDRMRSAVGSSTDLVLFYHNTDDQVPGWVSERPHFVFTYDDLDALGFSRMAKTLVPGSVHHAIQGFFRKNAHYNWYWFVEFDVRFRGSWADFFGAFDDEQADFLGMIVRQKSQDNQDWGHWRVTVPHDVSGPPRWLASFNPVQRLSHRGLSFLDRELQRGWIGHQEVLVPTLIDMAGMTVVDLGGLGVFTPERYRKQFYSLGWNSFYSKGKKRPAHLRGVEETMRANPPMIWAGFTKDYLYHPVKPFRQVIRWNWKVLKKRYPVTAQVSRILQRFWTVLSNKGRSSKAL